MNSKRNNRNKGNAQSVVSDTIKKTIKSTKNILFVMLTLAMVFTICGAYGVTVHAEDGPIVVTNNGELSDALRNRANASNNTTPTVVDIQKDILDVHMGDIRDKNIVINLNGYKLQCATSSLYIIGSTKLTINGKGEIRGGSDSYGNYAAIKVVGNSVVTLKNCQVFGANGTASVAEGGYGIEMFTTASLYLDNVLVRSGNSLGEADSISAINFDVKNNMYANNSTFQKGTGKLEGTMHWVIGTGSQGLGSVYENGEKITLSTDSSVAELIVGTGYQNKVDGNVINQDDGTPAVASSEVTATTTIPNPTYTVTIPSTIDFANQTQALEKYRDKVCDKIGEINVKKAFNVQATGVDNMFDGKKLFVTVNEAVNLSLEGGTKTIPCKVYQGESEYTTGTTFATFENEVQLTAGQTNTQAGAVSINRCDLTEAGNYKGTMNFTIEIKEAN